MEKGVDFHPGDDIHPLCLYGLGQPVVNNGMFLDTGVLSSRGPSNLTLFSQGLMWIHALYFRLADEASRAKSYISRPQDINNIAFQCEWKVDTSHPCQYGSERPRLGA